MITPKQAGDVLLYAPYGTCVRLVGQPGTAKSAVSYRTAKRAGAVYVGQPTADMDVLDGKGVPYLIEGADGRKMMAFAPPGTWPTEVVSHLYPKVGEIRVNLDDQGQAPPPVQAIVGRAVYGDGVARMLGDNPILPNVIFSATTNSVEDRASVHRTPSHTQNRFIDIRVQPDAEEWAREYLSGFPIPEPDSAYPTMRRKIEAAIGAGGPETIAAFVAWSKEVQVFDPNAPGPFQSGRSLETLGKCIRAFETAGINGDVLYEVACGCIGDAQASKFMAFHKFREDLPDTDAVLRGENVKLPAKPEVLFILSGIVLKAAKKEHVDGVVKLLNRMAVLEKDDRRIGVEPSVYLFRECLRGSNQNLQGVASHPEIAKEWLRKNGKYFQA